MGVFFFVHRAAFESYQPYPTPQRAEPSVGVVRKSRVRCSEAAVLAAERGEEEAVLAWLEGGGRVDATYRETA